MRMHECLDLVVHDKSVSAACDVVSRLCVLYEFVHTQFVVRRGLSELGDLVNSV